MFIINNTEKISIIIPIYNTGKYLKRCVDSVLAQTYQNIEVILVNDGSTDESSNICEWYKKQDKRVKVIHKKNGGVSSARNAGLENATGDYIGFVDSDDWVNKEMYEILLKAIKDTNSDVATLDYILVNNQKGYINRVSKNIKYKLYKDKEILKEYLLEGTKSGSYSCWRKLYKRRLFENIRFPEGKINEDIITNYKVLKNAKQHVKINYVGYYYWQDNESITRGGLKQRDFDLLYVSRELVDLSKNEEDKDIRYLAEVKLARSYFSLLARIAFYGIEDKEIDCQKTIKGLTRKLRQNIFLLMGSPIPLNRKLMILAVSINIKLLSLPLSIYKWITGK